MSAKRKPGGRPKLVEGGRTKKIDVRFTEDEYKIIEELEGTLGISKTDLVRVRLLNNASQFIVNAKALIAAVDAIGTELGRCGNNINQVARYANILQKQSKADPGSIERFNLLFGNYLQQQERLEICLRQIIRMIAR